MSNEKQRQAKKLVTLAVCVFFVRLFFLKKNKQKKHLISHI